MRSLILSTAVRFLLPLLFIFSVFLLFRGHNLPGGGFIGGLVAASALSLLLLAEGPSKLRASLKFDPRIYVGVGLAIALLSGMYALVFGLPFMFGMWVEIPTLWGGLKVGTITAFDIGVYLVTMGTVLAVLLPLAEEKLGWN